MRVCHLISGDLWAGPEVQTYTLLRELSSVTDLNVSAIVLNIGPLAQRLRELGIKVDVIDESKYSSFEIRKRLIEILAGESPDILHTHRYKENILGGTVKSKCNIRHLVQTVHGIQEGFSRLQRLKMNAYMFLNDRFTRRHFEKIIAVSHDIERYLSVKYGANKVITIHNAIDTSRRPTKSQDDMKAELGLNPECAVIGAVGRLVPIKGLDVFVDAAARILQKRPETTFVIAGDGPLRSELEGQVVRLGIDDRVKFTGFREDILDVFNMCDILGVTSYHEGVPISVLEAMSLERVVVSTTVGGIKEIIENRKSGILVDPGNPDAVADACLEVLGNRSLKETLQKGARKRIEAEFAASIQRERMLSLYNEVMQ
jgi:glycosyltransferase involved in cell wall biosynthesis